MGELYNAGDFYDLQYESYRDDIPHYLSLAADEPGRLLELGSGTGRLTEALLRAGHDVTGVELSAAMLERARQRPAGRAIVQGDIRRLPELGLSDASFSLVLAPFNVLMHLYNIPDQDLALQGAFAALQPGGLFALDLFVPEFGPMGVLRHVPEWDGLDGPDSQLFLHQEHDPLQQLITSHYLLDRQERDGALRRSRYRLVQRYWSRFELERALLRAGFDRIRLFGGFDRSRFSLQSRHMVVTCRKPAG